MILILFHLACCGGRLLEVCMSLQWTDVQNIALELIEKHPDVNPQYVNFVDLRNWVIALPDFSDDPNRSGEKILEAIQMAWMEEAS